MTQYDVAIVGASIAGSTAAALLGQQGLRVALLEKSPDPAHYKHLCTHELIASANPVFERLGLLEELTRIGGGHQSPHIWTKYGWIEPESAPGDELEQGLNVRREILDPLVRGVAQATDGVELMLGATVTEVVEAAGRPAGVRFRRGGEPQEISARVVVGADGRSSSVARMTGVPARIRAHARFGYAAYFENVPLASGRASQMWLKDPDVAYAFPTDGGLTLLASAPLRTPERLADYKADLDGAFARAFEGLDRAPDLAAGTRVSKFIGAVKVENKRRPAAAPGVAFIGDAAQTSDYVWGTGCGFAASSAAWLADAVGPALVRQASDTVVDDALAAYRRTHTRQLAVHHLMLADYSSGRPFSPAEKLLFAAGVVDGPTARAIHRLGGRAKTPQATLSPAVMARAAFVLGARTLRGSARKTPVSSGEWAPSSPSTSGFPRSSVPGAASPS
jgi:flavin-dependent dehydrogenase